MPFGQRVFPQLQRLLLVLFLLCVGMIWMKSLSTMTTRADTTHAESTFVHTARWASQSGRLYPPLDAPPHTRGPYGPLFLLMLAGAGSVCRGDDFQIRLLLRSVVFASYVVVGLVGYLLARNAGAPRSAAVLGAAAIWAAPQVLFWNVSVRPDFPALLLSMSGVWIVSRRASPALGAVVLSGVFCAAAVLLKQSLVAAPLAIALLFVLQRSYRAAAAFAASGLLVGLSVMGYLALRGEPVIDGILILRHSVLAVHAGVSILYSTLSVGLAALVVAGGVAGLVAAFGSTSRRQVHLLACYFVMALLVAALTLLHAGSNSNYLFEFWSIASVLSISALPQAEALWATMSQPLRIGAAIGLLLLTTQSLLGIRHPVQTVTEYNFDRLRDLHILSTEPSLAVRGKKPELLDPLLVAILEQRHVWTPAGIVDEISREEFDVVLTRQANHKPADYHGQPLLSLAVLDSLARFYEPLCHTPTMLVMKPKNRPVRFSLSDASYTLREACEPASDSTPRSGP